MVRSKTHKKRSLTERFVRKLGLTRKSSYKKPKNTSMKINMPNGNVIFSHKTKKVKKVGFSYLKKARKFLDFLTRNVESFGEKKHMRHELVAAAIQRHLGEKNILHEIGRDINADDDTPFSFVDNLYNVIQELFDEYDEEDDPDTKLALKSQMDMLAKVIDDAVSQGKAEYKAFLRSKTAIVRNENMASARSASSRHNNAPNNNVNDLAAMLGKMG